MKIILAKDAGFCFGVDKAVKSVYSALKDKKDLYSLGPFIHNPSVIKEFESKGLKIIDDVRKIKKGTVLIRTHGIDPSTFKIIKKKKLDFINTTCPFVKKLQHNIIKLDHEKFKIVIIGDKNHPEIKALLGYVKNKAVVINCVNDVDKLNMFPKIGVVVQTTYDFKKFKILSSLLLNKTNEIKIYNTICNATFNRQQNARNLTQQVDLMLIIGGKNSANTSCLYKLCKKYNKQTYHIETFNEIKKDWFKNIKKVGITGGASTPLKICKQIIKKIKEM